MIGKQKVEGFFCKKSFPINFRTISLSPRLESHRQDGDVLPDWTFAGKDWFVTYSAYAIGRMECIWGGDCREFKPERWLEISGVFLPESPYWFPVFHARPRMCLGKEVAYIQMKSIVASVVERYETRVAEQSNAPEMLLFLTMRMKGGLLVRVRERALC